MEGTAQRHWGFYWITYPLLGVYFLPVAMMGYAAWMGNALMDSAHSVPLAEAVSGAFSDHLRTTLGTIMMPFITAYAVDPRLADGRIPGSTVVLFAALLGGLLLVTALYGYVEYQRAELSRAAMEVGGKETNVYELLGATLLTYAKETLGYVALVLGVTVGRTAPRQEEEPPEEGKGREASPAATGDDESEEERR